MFISAAPGTIVRGRLVRIPTALNSVFVPHGRGAIHSNYHRHTRCWLLASLTLCNSACIFVFFDILSSTTRRYSVGATSLNRFATVTNVCSRFVARAICSHRFGTVTNTCLRFSVQARDAQLSTADKDFIPWAKSAGVSTDKLRVANFDGMHSAAPLSPTYTHMHDLSTECLQRIGR